MNTAHHVDVGGAAAGSQRVQNVSEAFQEGIRVLPIKLVREGKLDEEILRVILGNVRLPQIVRGDLIAQQNANVIGASRFVSLYGQHGRDILAAAIDEILDRSEAQVRAEIDRIPDGTYAFEDCLDDCGTASGLVHIRVTVTIRGSDVEIDFSKTDDSVPVALNS